VGHDRTIPDGSRRSASKSFTALRSGGFGVAAYTMNQRNSEGFAFKLLVNENHDLKLLEKAVFCWGDPEILELSERSVNCKFDGTN
jgi:hypothetical protein